MATTTKKTTATKKTTTTAKKTTATQKTTPTVAAAKKTASKEIKYETTIKFAGGKYWIYIDDRDEHIQVTCSWDNAEKAFEGFAKEIGFQIDKKWKVSEKYDKLYDYIKKEKIKTDYSIDRVGEKMWVNRVYGNPMEGLRNAAALVSFKADRKWTIREFARHLIDRVENGG